MPRNAFGLPSLYSSKRKPIKKKGSKVFELRLKQKGKCWKCHKSFDTMRVRPQTHHKNGKNSDNRLSNLALVCPNCHDKLSHKQTLKRRKKSYSNVFKLKQPKRFLL